MRKRDALNGLLHVDSASPGGMLLRRYWQPICAAADLQSTSRMRITVMGESLLLFRDESQNFRLVSEHCPHRGASLYYGFIEDGGLRCPYHGWLFGGDGQCIEKPFEPGLYRESFLRSYPVRVAAGLVFAYMGPSALRPEFPVWDLLRRTRGCQYIEIQPEIRANWLQVQENAADVTHTYFLHSYYMHTKGLPDASGFGRPLARYGFQPFPFGLIKSWVYDGPSKSAGWGNLLVFPNMLRLESEMHWRVPIDDNSTRIIVLGFESIDPTASDGGYKLRYVPNLPLKDPNGRYSMDSFQSQDAMAFETPGEIYDRENEQLGASDIGVIMFRNMLIEQVKLLPAQEPLLGILAPGSDPNVDLRLWMGGDRAMSCEPDSQVIHRLPPDQVFDGRHRTVDVPFGKARNWSR